MRYLTPKNGTIPHINVGRLGALQQINLFFDFVL